VVDIKIGEVLTDDQYGLYLLAGVICVVIIVSIVNLFVPKTHSTREHFKNWGVLIVLCCLGGGAIHSLPIGLQWFWCDNNVSSSEYRELIIGRNSLPMENQLVFKAQVNVYLENKPKLSSIEFHTLETYVMNVKSALDRANKEENLKVLLDNLKREP